MRHSILAIILWVVPVSSSAQVPVDARFVLETVASGAGAVCLEIDAAGVLYVCEKRGRLLRLVPNGSGGYAAPVVVLDIRGEVDAGVEGGLLGLALAPDFATSRQLYALFTTASDQRIERWTLDAARTAVQAGGRSVVLSGLPRATAEHKAGHIAFRPGDATHLYVSLGDDAAPALAQNLDAYNGKILRIRAASGQGETDNPHYDGNLGSVRSRVFARGMRNPFRFVFHPTEHALYVSENGDDTDRISRVRPGSNGSWSTAGDSADYLNPPDTNFRVMQTIPPRSSLVGLHVVSGGPFGDPGGGAGYTLWVANAFNEAGRGIRRFAVSGAALDTLTALDGGGSFVLPSGFSFGAEIELGPDGALYMTQAGVDEADGPGFATVSRLRFAGGEAPVASFTASPDPEAGGLVPFSLALADTSTDEDGTIASRMWTFGDGATSTAASPTHVYTHAGTYTLTLRVVDDDGLVGMRSVSVRVRVSATVRFMLTVRDGDTREGGPPFGEHDARLARSQHDDAHRRARRRPGHPFERHARRDADAGRPGRRARRGARGRVDGAIRRTTLRGRARHVRGDEHLHAHALPRTDRDHGPRGLDAWPRRRRRRRGAFRGIALRVRGGAATTSPEDLHAKARSSARIPMRSASITYPSCRATPGRSASISWAIPASISITRGSRTSRSRPARVSSATSCSGS
jgi:glucose/arabinose dehydrogenase